LKASALVATIATPTITGTVASPIVDPKTKLVVVIESLKLDEENLINNIEIMLR
jgi:hypothetical protein